jgi:S1-C subfamily serine protease
VSNTANPSGQETSQPAADQAGFSSCMVMLLLVVAFFVGGLLGGLGGGGLVLWATGSQLGGWPPAPQLASLAYLAGPAEAPAPTSSTTAALSPLPTATPTPTPNPTPTLAAPPSATPSLADAVSQVVPAVVTIINREATLQRLGATVDARIRGSGTLIDRRGYIVTNYHVVEGASQVAVILSNQQELVGQLVASDTQQDIALVRVENPPLPAARWGDSDRLRPGEWAIAIGSALGDFPNSVTVGVISGVDRSLEVSRDLRVSGLIQTDAAINKGNSGGPLINQHGEVIGINTFIIREGENTGVAEGIGFAIPANRARPIVEAWIAADEP